MSLFNRNTAAINTGTQYPSGISSRCSAEYCSAALTVDADPQNLVEGYLDNLNDSALAWYDAVVLGRNLTIQLQDTITESLNQNRIESGINHRERRQQQSENNRQITYDLSSFRSTAKEDVRIYFEDNLKIGDINESLMNPAIWQNGRLEAAFSKLDKKQVVHSNDEADRKNAFGVVIIDGKSVANPYHNIFVQEVHARIRLGILVRIDPETASDFLDPERYGDYPEYLQRFIATEIANGEDSLILKFMKEWHTGSGDFFNYLCENNISPAAKEQAFAIGIGARALQGSNCAANVVGLCRDVAEAIPIDVLPAHILDDMQRKRQSSQQQLISQLQSYSRLNKVGAWWSMNTDYPDAPLARQSGSKNQGSLRNSPSPEAGLTEGLKPPIKKEISAPKQTEIAVVNADVSMLIETANVTEIRATIDNILATKEFTDYLSKFKHDKSLRTFLESVLDDILVAPYYYHVKGFKPISYRSKAQLFKEGQKLKKWRVSGAEYQGHSSDVIKKTRILFASNRTRDNRTVQILSVAHKSDIDKLSKGGKLLR